MLFPLLVSSTLALWSIPPTAAPHPQPTPVGKLTPMLDPDTPILTIPLRPGEAPLSLGLKELMTLFRVPGVSVAVIDNYQIAWARGYGVTEPGGSAPVTTRTLFQAASVSKPITAVGALALVDQGKLSLDEDVNQKLTSWKVPESAFTAQEKVTLRRILSHSAGFNVHGFAGYLAGEPLPRSPPTPGPSGSPTFREASATTPGAASRWRGSS